MTAEPGKAGGAALSGISKERAELLKLLLESRSRKTGEIRSHGRSGSGGADFPASRAQQRLWFVDQVEEGSAGYQVPIVLRLLGTLDRGALHKALDAIVQRHDVLRTVLVSDEGDLRQRVTDQRSFTLQVIDLSVYGEAECEDQIRKHKMAEVGEKFDLRAGPLVRGRLLRTRAREHVLLMTLHHVVADNWSKGVLIRELQQLYAAYRYGRTTMMEPLPIQYADYAIWQREWLQGTAISAQLAYWKSKLADSACELNLPADRPRPASQSYRGGNVQVVVGSQLTGKLRFLASQQKTTLFMVLCAAWAVLLFRLTGQEDILVGTPVANRQRPELEGLIGMFVNTLVLRFKVQGQLRVVDFLRHVKEVTLAAYDHQDVPFEMVVEALQPQRSLSRNPLFQVMFALQNTPKTPPELPDLKVSIEDAVDAPAIFDLMLPLEERGAEIAGSLNYAADLFDRETVERWMSSYLVVLRGMAENALDTIRELDILPFAELRQVTEIFNDTRTPYPRDRSIEELFEDQVRRAPDSVALISITGDCLSYATTNTKANQLAHYMRSVGVQVGDYVGIAMRRGVQSVIAHVAILKCGAAYLPLDLDQPPERRAFLIRDSDARFVISDIGEAEALHWDGVQCIDLAKAQSACDVLPRGNLRLGASPNVPAYVMYTSGSTGTPKGVIVPRSAVNRLVINNSFARIKPTDCLVHCSNPTFDASTFEIWAPLLNGARLLVVSQHLVLDGKSLTRTLVKEGASVLWMTVGLFSQHIAELQAAMPYLRYVITGGDVVEPGIVRSVLKNNPPEYFLNAYGPTECTTFSSTYVVESVDEDAKTIPIGRPISNAQFYILDSQLRPVPIGVTGEIYIGGDGLALGYLNRPDLTAQKFVANPFGADWGSRIYKTGDLGRWKSNGIVEFVGRNDQQVKIRGFRVELGEIETLLCRHAGVREAAVITRADRNGGKLLVAYVTPRGERLPSAKELRAHLEAELPEYMVPAAYVTASSLPLTSNGKLDRRALPSPGVDAFARDQYEAPQGEVEETLAEIWRELLGAESIGRDDNFFGMGGHSLLVLKALFRIERAFGCSLGARDVYRNPTLRGLAARISGQDSEDQFVDLSVEATLPADVVVTPAHKHACTGAILLTGATGFVGRFVLAQLIRDTKTKIYCLVRATSRDGAAVRLKETLSKWNLGSEEVDARVVAIAGNMGAPRLGLDQATYELLARNVATVYHCATSMNHLETYAAARQANVESARELLRFSLMKDVKLVNYVSTVSVFGASAVSRTVTEETPIDHEKHLESSGYSASKWVAEKIFMVGRDRGIPCNIFRLGLVWADAQLGRYDEAQREYRILKSCLLSGVGIKNYRYEVPPIPVDHVARAIITLANEHRHGGGTFHICGSGSVVEDVFERFTQMGAFLRLVPLYEWVGEMKRLYVEGRSMPAVPLIEFAFSMNEEVFYRHHNRRRTANLKFGGATTAQELKRLGVVVESFQDGLLRSCFEGLLSRDAELRHLCESRRPHFCDFLAPISGVADVGHACSLRER